MGARTLADLADRLGRDLDTATAATSWPELDHRVRPDVAAVSAAVTQYAQEAEGAERATGVTPFGSGSLAGASASLASGLSGSLDALLDRRQQELASNRDRPVLLALGALLVLGYLLVAVWRSTSQDVRALLEDISTISNGQQPRQPAMEGSDEFARMSRAMTITRDRLTSLLGSLRYQATHDELTALGNRTLFTDKIAEALAERGPGVAVVVADLDHFRDVNDSFGHAMGDRLLRAVGVRFHGPAGGRTWWRAWAATSSASCCRPAAASPRRSTWSSGCGPRCMPPIDVDGRLLQVRATFGVAIAGEDRRGAGELVGTRTSPSRRRATPHPGRVTTARPPPASPSSNRGCTSARGPHGAVRGTRRGGRPGRAGARLPADRRPRDAGRARRRGARALEPPIRGLVPPTVFVPLAEATGSIVPIGRWVLREAARQLARWRAEFPDGYPLTMEVNLSTGQLADPGLVPSVVALSRRPAWTPATSPSRSPSPPWSRTSTPRSGRCASSPPSASGWRSTTSAPATRR